MKAVLSVTHIQNFKDGNNHALSLVYREFAVGVTMVAYRYLQNKEEAKDVMMEVFEKMLSMTAEERVQKIPRDPDALKGWLYMVTKNLSLDWIKHRKIVLRYLETREDDPVTVSDAEHRWDTQALEQVMKHLIESEQRVARLHFAGYTHEEIANRLNVSYNTVRNQLSSAKKKIRKYISPTLIVLMLHMLAIC